MIENRFEPLADIDVDGATFQVGIHHYAFGPPRPAMVINSGAVAVEINVYHADLDAMISALRSAKRKLKARGVAG